MRTEHDLATLDWELAGYIPHLWEMEKNQYLAEAIITETPWIPACVPGSVQAALRNAGIIPDWNIGDQAKECEWVENRHWLFRTRIPDAWMNPGSQFTLVCEGLDYSGWIYVNGRRIGLFKGTHIPHRFSLEGYLSEKDNMLEIIFDCPPRWLGQFGYTSTMTEWKTRFNYTWDWAPRMVQTGIWSTIHLMEEPGASIHGFRCTADVDLSNGSGELWMKARVAGDQTGDWNCELRQGERLISSKILTPETMELGMSWTGLPVQFWWPNGMGEQPLYELTCSLRSPEGEVLDCVSRRVGFRHVAWQACEGAPAAADPWICVINGLPVFLQGFNFQPIRVNYADLTVQDYLCRMEVYKDIGTNFFRINACGFLEHECFYELCDDFGFMVWQEFPLTSSGLDNWPPEDETSIREVSQIARSFIERRQHHPSLVVWGGGNEQQGDKEGRKSGMGKPCTLEHPMLARLGEVVHQEDPTRRYIPTSPLGPVTGSDPRHEGEGIHWDVHGPNLDFPSEAAMKEYWDHDDALFRAEIYVSGAASADGIRKYRGEWAVMPASRDNPYWRRPTPWWNDWDLLVADKGREPESLDEYVQWSQRKQADRLAFAMKACKDRFPRIGGALMWGSHDTTPMPVNTTIMDFDGCPKESAWTLKRIWTESTAEEHKEKGDA